jgi:hypothetical protein
MSLKMSRRLWRRAEEVSCIYLADWLIRFFAEH